MTDCFWSRFTSDWAKYAVDKGLAEAINALSNKEIRKILVPKGEWNGIIRKYTSFTGEDCTTNPLYQVQFPLMFVLVIEIMMLVSFIIMATDIADVIDVSVVGILPNQSDGGLWVVFTAVPLR